MRSVDLSFPSLGYPVTPDWWRQVKADGYGLAVVGTWGGRDSNTEAERWLRDARAAGLLTATYFALNGSHPGAWHVAKARELAGAEWARCLFAAVDCEVNDVTEPIVAGAVTAVQDSGLLPIIYTAAWWWRGRFGDPANFASLRLWTADYDGNPAITFPDPYGGWTAAVGKQWAGDARLHGVKVDLSTFDDGWIGSLVREREVDMDAETRNLIKALATARHGADSSFGALWAVFGDVLKRLAPNEWAGADAGYSKMVAAIDSLVAKEARTP